ncbi:MAG: hypothetical protein JWP97_13 [Labilithrix sp.]|nr:hypothetical protein [Labilithrix sp.]
MGVRRRLSAHALALLVASLGVAGVSCKRKPPPHVEEAPPDRLAPDEVVEGNDKAFGLPLPRACKVTARFRESARVTSTVTPEQLSNFVRKRVTDGTVTPGTSSTKLDNVVPRDDKQKRLGIEIRPLHSPDGFKSEMIVRDTTPPPFDPSLTEDQRWQKAGLTPGGTQLLDPKHLE